ncbi:Sphingolipid delta(4)-desaturase [Mycena venus]|uniref:Sphingolipid delta(4)-desaturase n=1 Tax=Mycena venus TaxID=2733690 RepID=A0A8H6XY62_9AGAR|nr:Sphingolipid delta(4)-desaturase [Mycena venus]
MSSSAGSQPVDFSLFGGAESLTEGKKSNRTPRRVVPSRPTEEDDGIAHVAPPQDPADFLWLMTEEPHRSRRMEILKAHPEVTKLMGHEPLTKYVVLGVVALQLYCAFALRHTRPTSPLFLFCAYAIGGTANHNLFLAIHEITHNLAFKGIVPNKLLAMFANLPHRQHHKFMGQDGIDVDLPTRLELLLLNNVLGKVFFAIFQILFYALRPGLVRSQRFGPWHALNIVVQLLFNYALVSTLGWRPFVYLLASSFFAGSLHPCAGHFIAEHYLWDGLEQETYSYYGPLNVLAYNVGYHNEHHDFPSIPWTRLPRVARTGTRGEVGIFARAKRLSKAASAAAAASAKHEDSGLESDKSE